MNADRSEVSCSPTVDHQLAPQSRPSSPTSRPAETTNRAITRKPLPERSRALVPSAGLTSLSTKREEETGTPEAAKLLADQTGARKKTTSTRVARLLLDTWLVECACLVLGSSCLVTIFILLFTFHGQPLRQWHSDLSINTILSGLATAMRGFTMLATAAAIGQLKWTWVDKKERPLQDLNIYDGASRGPAGAINLLCHLRFWHLASIGCVVTVLSLASDAFVQASVVIATRPTLSLGAASVPVAAVHQLDTYDAYMDKHSLWLDVSRDLMDNQMRLGVYTAFVGESNVEDNRVTAACPSGNCKFPRYASLGVYSECVSRTNEIIIDYHTKENKTRNLTASFEVLNPYNGYQEFTLNVYRTAEELSVEAINVTVFKTFWSMTDPIVRMGILLADLEGLLCPNGVDSTKDGWEVLKAGQQNYFTAYQCDLSFAALVYQGEVANGTLHESEVRRVITPASNDGDILVFDVDTSDLPNSAAIIVDDADGEALAFYLSSTLNSGNPLGNGFSSDAKMATCGLVSEMNHTDLASNDIASALWQKVTAQGVPSVMDDFASALTRTMRTNTAYSIFGDAIETEAYIQVRWPYMIVPTLLILLSIGFVGVTIWRTGRRGLSPWKSNLVAAIVHAGMWIEHKHEVESADHLIQASDIEEWAKGTSVRHRPRVRVDESDL